MANPTRGQGQQDACTGVATAFTIVSSMFIIAMTTSASLNYSVIIVGLRTYVRVQVLRNFGKDDVFMIAALVRDYTSSLVEKS